LNGIVYWREQIKCKDCGEIALESSILIFVGLASGSRIFCPHCALNGMFEKEYAPDQTIHFEWQHFLVKDESGQEHEELRKIYNKNNRRKLETVPLFSRR
jgi:hypothetical protein